LLVRDSGISAYPQCTICHLANVLAATRKKSRVLTLGQSE